MLLMVKACSISPVTYLIKTQADLTVALLSQLSFYDDPLSISSVISNLLVHFECPFHIFLDNNLNLII